jgi:gliding motility-associated-like protein
LAVLLTLLAFYSQVVRAQTKKFEQAYSVKNASNCNCSLFVTQLITNSSACDKKDGAISISTTGGSGDFLYKWKTQAGVVVSSLKDLTGVLPGSYFLEVTDIQSPYCGTYMYGFTVNSNLVLNTAHTDVTNCAVANGSITPTVTGGSGVYTYRWKMTDGTEVTTKNLTGLKAGSYFLVATDAKLGCSVSASVYVRANNPLTINQNSLTPNTSCATPNGGVDVRVAGGSGQYQFYWYDLESFGVVSDKEDLTGIKGADYSVFVSDKVSGCSGYQYYTVAEQTVRPQFSLKDIKPNTQCSSPFDGAATLEITGSSGPYDVTWLKNGETVTTQQNPTNLNRGVYSFTITDSQTKCQTFVPDTLTIADASIPHIKVTLDVAQDNTQCIKFDGALSVSVDDPKVPYTLSWTGPNNFTSSKASLTGLAAGNYFLTVEASCNKPPVIAQPNPTLETRQITLDLLALTTDPDNNLDPSAFAIVDQPLSKAHAVINPDHTLDIDYAGISFRGTDQVKVKACDVLSACTERTLSWTVDVNAEASAAKTGEVIVHNAVAPNSSGDNHYMRIVNLPTDNKVSIFNRWGDLVYGTQNYNDETPGKRFEGLSSDGKSLPSGTYFYKIEFADGRSALTGYLALKQ